MKTTNKTPKKPGRKPIVIDHDKVEQLAAQGLGTTQIARALGVSWDTIDRNRKRSADFEDALKRGEARGLAKVSNSLFKSANDGNVTAQIFYLKNRDTENWRDRQEVVTATINLNDVISGAKERLCDNTATLEKPRVINAVKSTHKEKNKLIDNQSKEMPGSNKAKSGG